MAPEKDGGPRIGAIHVHDLARLCVDLGQSTEPVVVDTVGPESLTSSALVSAIRTAVGGRALILQVPGALVPVLSGGLGVFLRDRLLTSEEHRALSPARPALSSVQA